MGKNPQKCQKYGDKLATKRTLVYSMRAETRRYALFDFSRKRVRGLTFSTSLYVSKNDSESPAKMDFGFTNKF